jgi:hypothetical protein
MGYDIAGEWMVIPKKRGNFMGFEPFHIGSFWKSQGKSKGKSMKMKGNMMETDGT